MRPNTLFMVCFLSWAFTVLSLPVALGQNFELGKEIYRTQCLECHGEKGIGNPKHYDQPLHGDLSAVELAKVIQETMPEANPRSLSDTDAAAVAYYVHHEFYSSMAQLRNAPPTVELCHLTTGQFRQSVADLMAPFTGTPQKWTDKRGLTRTISNGKWGKERFVYESDKLDTHFRFDWRSDTPLAEMAPDKWSVRWEGSIYAPTTGVYEFFMDSSIRSNLFVNGNDTPLIDAAVVSFENTLNTGSIYLLGGRSYNIAFDANKTKEPSAKFSLEWKIPNGSRQPIPSHYLSPTWSPNLLVTSTPFPPDDSSVGYERGRSVSKEWDEATTFAAIEVGNKLADNLKRWMPNNDNNPTDRDAVQRWCVRWVSLALRHKLTDEEAKHYVRHHFENDETIGRAIKKVTLLTLKSPMFQYPTLSLDGNEAKTAALALALWDSIPDERMLEPTPSTTALSREQIDSLVEQMLDSPRANYKLMGFLNEYLGVRSLKDMSKDSRRFPDFNSEVAGELRMSFELFLAEFANNPNRDLRELLTAEHLYLNGPLAKLYGFDLPPDAPFQRVVASREQRAGILSHPYLMTGFAYDTTSSPIHRGVFLAKRVLGRNLRPPVDAIIPVPEEAAPNMTTRERVAMQTSGAMCQSCHRVINPLGFALEHYDAIGRYREDEGGKAIDSRGSYLTIRGEKVEFDGIRNVAEFLSQSDEVHQAMVRQLFQYLVKQPLAAYGVERTSGLDKQFAAEGYALKPLIKRLMAIVANAE